MDQDTAPLELRSKRLFGNAHLLTVGAWVANAVNVFCAADVVAATGVPSTSVHRTLKALASESLLVRLPRSTTERTQWFQRVDHSFWAAVSDLAADAPRIAGMRA